MSMEDMIRTIVKEEMQTLFEDIQKLMDSRDLKPTPKYMRVAQAAEMLNVSPSTMYSMTKEEGFPAIRKGHNKTVMIEFAELQKWLESNRQRIS